MPDIIGMFSRWSSGETPTQERVVGSKPTGVVRLRIVFHTTFASMFTKHQVLNRCYDNGQLNTMISLSH